jgi:putative oxidoreductase
MAPDRLVAALHGRGVPLSASMSWVTIATAFFGGLAILLGFFIPLFSIPMTILLLVPISTVHWKFGFSSVKLASVDSDGIHFRPPGYEVDLLYLAASANPPSPVHRPSFVT